MGNFLKNSFIMGFITVLIFTASWAVYRMLNKGAEDLLAMIGITNLYAQGLIIVVVVVIILVVVARTKVGEAFAKILKL